ncbi:phage major capsid protein [Rhodococcus erythropolis]|uniref:phage major capsid protein n=1 Tax=Rhodococcus erythropolis TaxID=1833 RepID=UPI002227AF0E|nr:phage major capsid protein [Rhodococcus erythropolis]MCW2300734.1 HK97 family phage major capsid protein [Rhodococcus erythropolis]
MAPKDINRGTAGIVLPKDVSTEIWQNTIAQSAIQQLARQIPLPGGGVDVPIITGDPVAEWVSETEEKPVSRSTFGSKNIKGYTLAVIEPFSNQFRRDLPALFQALVTRLPGVLAKKFDATAFGFVASPGSGFDTLAAAPSVSINTNVYDGFLAGLSSVATNEGDVTSWVLSTQAEIAALGAKDTQGRPIFTDSVTDGGAVSNVLARPVVKSQNVFKAGTVGSPGTAATVGFAGDWNSAVWGYVEGIKIDISDQASLNDGGSQLNLWQRNMFAVRAEFEVGFAVRDANRFVRLTGATPV